jgi:hypothetical protein
VAAKLYALKLRYRDSDCGLDTFTRALDLDDPATADTIDGILRKLLVAAIDADGGKTKGINSYSLQVRERGDYRPVITFRMSREELDL